MKEETKHLLEEIETFVKYLLEDLPKVTFSEDEKMWKCRNSYALGISNAVKEILNSSVSDGSERRAS